MTFADVTFNYFLFADKQRFRCFVVLTSIERNVEGETSTLDTFLLLLLVSDVRAWYLDKIIVFFW
jgi:hypothetical protein